MAEFDRKIDRAAHDLTRNECLHVGRFVDTRDLATGEQLG
jgi:hypothetical protein